MLGKLLAPQLRKQAQHFARHSMPVTEVLAQFCAYGLSPIPFRHCCSPKQTRQAGGESWPVARVCGDLGNSLKRNAVDSVDQLSLRAKLPANFQGFAAFHSSRAQPCETIVDEVPTG
jgi:hypothetical protein